MSARKNKKRKIEIPSEEEVAAYGKGDEAASDEGAFEAVADEASVDEVPTDEAGLSMAEQTEQWKDKFLRAKAELANVQRRAEKGQSEALKYSNGGLIRSLLPVLDDLERVIASSAESGGDVDSVVGGVKLVLENFVKVLGDANVKVIEAEGQPFDPEIHEAMMQQPSDEHAEPTVLQEVGKGYKLHDRVLRPARVIVSKPTETEESE